MTDRRGNFARRSITSGLLFAAVMGLGGGAGSILAGQGDNPADHRAVDSNRNISYWLNDLSDEDPGVRESARQNLLNLRRKDLAGLRAAVKEQQPLPFGEEEDLRDVVTHIFLSDAAYEQDESIGFLGVTFDREQEYLNPEGGGVEIRRRLPGFCGYRCLRVGDVVLRIGLLSNKTYLDIEAYMQISQAIQTYSAGQTVNLEVLRDGRVIVVPIVLDARPKLAAGIGVIDEFETSRRMEADEFWEQQFAPLLENHSVRAALK